MSFPQYRSTSSLSSSSRGFQNDVEFSKLISRNEEVDQARVFFEFAKDRCPKVCFQEGQKWIQSCINELRTVMLKSDCETERLEMIINHLTLDCGLYGHPGYQEFASSYDLDCLIKKKCGSPIALAVLFRAIAAPLGIETELIALSPRVLLRCETSAQTLFIDMYDSGMILTFEEASQWLQKKNGISQHEAEAELDQHPISSRKLALKTLYHLKHSLQNGDHPEQLWKVQSRLAALKPACYEERRDLGLTALKTNRPGNAVSILQECLKSCPENEKQMLTKKLTEAKKSVTLWN